MRIKYDSKLKQLSIIAGNIEEQDELEANITLMRHSDVCFVNELQSRINQEHALIYFDGEFERRNRVSLTLHLSPDVVGYQKSRQALDEFWAAVEDNQETIPERKATVIYLWPGETPRDGWNTIVLGHA